jgi:CRP/FNR family transcriptional regulator, cyclic AMP receptor protein
MTAPEDDQPSASLLDSDARLVQHIPADALGEARRDTTMCVIDAAESEPLREIADRMPRGAVIFSGVVLRELHLGGCFVPELLGPGELLAPPAGSSPGLPAVEDACALMPLKLGIFEPPMLHALARWPEVAFALVERLQRQRRRAAVHGAICQLPRIQDRLLAWFGHVAEEWGEPAGDGVTVPFPFTDQTLGRCLGAPRPTVTLAVQHLAEEQLLRRRDDGSWLLTQRGEERLSWSLEGRSGR